MHLRQRLQARRFHGKKILSGACTASHTPSDRTSSSSRLHNRDAILELPSPFIHLCTTRTPVTVLNSHPTMNLCRFHAFAKQKSHNTSLLLLGALLQGHRHLVELFPRFLCVPQACQRYLLVAQGHRLRTPYTQWYRSYTRFLIQLFRFSTERPLYVQCCRSVFGRCQVHILSSLLILDETFHGVRLKASARLVTWNRPQLMSSTPIYTYHPSNILTVCYMLCKFWSWNRIVTQHIHYSVHITISRCLMCLSWITVLYCEWVYFY